MAFATISYGVDEEQHKEAGNLCVALMKLYKDQRYDAQERETK
jgi:hypothetical protein